MGPDNMGVRCQPLEGLVIERDLPKRVRPFLRHGPVVMSPQHREKNPLNVVPNTI